MGFFGNCTSTGRVWSWMMERSFLGLDAGNKRVKGYSLFLRGAKLNHSQCGRPPDLKYLKLGDISEVLNVL